MASDRKRRIAEAQEILTALGLPREQKVEPATAACCGGCLPTACSWRRFAPPLTPGVRGQTRR
jgi:hypothetical protein